MAIGKASDLTIYNEEFIGGYVDQLQQNSNFNEATQNTLVLRSRFHEGDYSKEAMFDLVTNLVSRRDTTSVSAATDLSITSDEFIGVKLNRKIGPVAQTLDAWKKLGRDERMISFVIGQQVAKAQQVEILNSALAALEGKLDAVAALEHSAVDGTLASTDLVTGLSKAGDSAGDIVAWIMHSKPYFDLIGNQTTNAIYRANGVRIMEGTPATYGRPVFVTDSASLVESQGVSSAADAYSTLGLRAGAAIAEFSEPETVVMDLVSGLENIVYRMQGEFAYTLSLKGCKWDVANGAANPDGAAVATATNWDNVVADNKSLPGIIIKSQ